MSESVVQNVRPCSTASDETQRTALVVISVPSVWGISVGMVNDSIVMPIPDSSWRKPANCPSTSSPWYPSATLTRNGPRGRRARES